MLVVVVVVVVEVAVVVVVVLVLRLVLVLFLVAGHDMVGYRSRVGWENFELGYSLFSLFAFGCGMAWHSAVSLMVREMRDFADLSGRDRPFLQCLHPRCGASPVWTLGAPVRAYDGPSTALSISGQRVFHRQLCASTRAIVSLTANTGQCNTGAMLLRSRWRLSSSLRFHIVIRGRRSASPICKQVGERHVWSDSSIQRGVSNVLALSIALGLLVDGTIVVHVKCHLQNALRLPRHARWLLRRKRDCT